MRLERYGKAVVVRSDILSDGQPDTKLFAKALREAGGSWNSRLKTEDPAGWVFAGNKAAEILALINSFNAQTGMPLQNELYGEELMADPNRPTSPGALMQAVSGFRPGSPGLSSWAGTAGSSSSIVAPEPVTPAGPPAFSFPSGLSVNTAPSIRPVALAGSELTPFPPSDTLVGATQAYIDEAGNPHVSFHSGLYAARATIVTKQDLLRYGSVEVGAWMLRNFTALQKYIWHHPDTNQHFLLINPESHEISDITSVGSAETVSMYDLFNRAVVTVPLWRGHYFIVGGVALQPGFGPEQKRLIRSPFDKYDSRPVRTPLLENSLVRLFTEINQTAEAGGILLRQTKHPQNYILVSETGQSGPHKAYRVIFLTGRPVDVSKAIFESLVRTVTTSPFPLSIAPVETEQPVLVKEFIIIVDTSGPKFYYGDGRLVENMLLELDSGVVSLSGQWKLVRHLKNF